MVAYDFIEKIGRIKINYRRKCLGVLEEFTSEAAYNDKLDKYFREFRKEIINLPFLVNTRQSRKTVLKNLHDEFIHTKESLNGQVNRTLQESYDCIYKRKFCFRYIYPRFLKKRYLTKVRSAYQKLHLVCLLHNNKIEEAMEMLKSIALNDGIELKTIEQASFERIKINLSSPELAFLSILIMKKIAQDENFNRTLFSNILADHFSTKKADAPKASQIRKQFTEVNDNVRKNVGKLLTELSATCMSEHS